VNGPTLLPGLKVVVREGDLAVLIKGERRWQGVRSASVYFFFFLFFLKPSQVEVISHRLTHSASALQ
jgi:hypothetical protein